MKDKGVSGITMEKILGLFTRYYDVRTDGVPEPFCALAEFKSHTEQYFLVKAAKLSDIDSKEYVFFAKEAELSAERARELAECAWQNGISKVLPYYGHRNTDVSLVILSKKIPENSFKQIKKINHYKSYKFGFYGWSSFRLMACETSTGRTVSNRRGSDLRRLAAKI